MNILLAYGNKEQANWLEMIIELSTSSKIKYLQNLKQVKDLIWADVLIVDPNNPGNNFISRYRKLREVSKKCTLLVLGSRDHLAMEMFNWDENTTEFVGDDYSIESLQSILKHLNDNVNTAKEKEDELELEEQSVNFSGLTTVQLADMLQMLCLTRWTGRIKIKNPITGEIGNMYINKGVVAHAETSTNASDEACYEMLTWERTEFIFSEKYFPVLQSINIPWESILMEGARRLDEQLEAQRINHVEHNIA